MVWIAESPQGLSVKIYPRVVIEDKLVSERPPMGKLFQTTTEDIPLFVRL